MMLIDWNNLSALVGDILIRLPLILGALVVLIVIRSLITRILLRLLIRLFSRATNTDTLETTLRKLLIVPVNYLLIAALIDVFARIYEIMPPISTLIFQVTRTLVLVAALVFFLRLINVLVSTRGGLFRFTGVLIEESLLPFARTGLQLLVVLIGAAVIVATWGYDISGLIAGLGIGGLAISLAAQDTLSNLFGFTALVSDRPFHVGEYIKTPDVEGTVEQVGIRSTRVRQMNQALVSIPNSKLAASTILNWSRLSKRQIDFTLVIHYNTPSNKLDQLLAAIREHLSQHDSVDSASVVVYLIKLSAQGIEILVRCYLNITDWTAFTAEKERILLDLMRVIESLDIAFALPYQPVALTPDSQITVRGASKRGNRPLDVYENNEP